MSHTYSQMYIQTVFAVKFRAAIIDKKWRNELMAVIGNLIDETGSSTIIVNGIEDHVHCFFALKPDISVSKVMQSAKAKSSKWVNESGLLEHRFEWQTGFGCFSYSKSHVDKVYRYIQNQEIHHQNQNFKDEYMAMLTKYEVDFDEHWIFEDLI